MGNQKGANSQIAYTLFRSLIIFIAKDDYKYKCVNEISIMLCKSEV